MGPRTRTSLALIFTVVVCAYQWMGVGGGRFSSVLWPLCGLLLMIAAMAINASEMRAAGVPIGFTHGRKLPVAGLSFSAVVTVLVITATLAKPFFG